MNPEKSHLGLILCQWLSYEVQGKDFSKMNMEQIEGLVYDKWAEHFKMFDSLSLPDGTTFTKTFEPNK